MSLLPQGSSSIVKIFLLSFRLFRASFIKTVGFGFIIALSAGQISLFINKWAFTIYRESIENGSNSAHLFADIIFSEAFYLSAPLFIMMMLGFVFSGAIIYQIDQSAKQKQSNYKKAFLISLKKLPSLLLAAILRFIFILLATVVAAIASMLIVLLLKSVGFNLFSGDYNIAALYSVPMLLTPISALLMSFYIPFLYTVWYLQFHDLKLRSRAHAL